ncbi:MAG: hypothetical protein IPK22_07505 [Verrucomicrobiaceae bacterium]|nr:hypothetical protein [Verrucomicrobiaceae bacterium]
MSTLLSRLVRFIGSKLLTFIVILAILLIATWVQSEWAELSRLLDETKGIEKQIAERQSTLNELRHKAQELDEATRNTVQKIKDLDEVARLAQQEYSQARRRWEKRQEGVAWLLPEWLDGDDWAAERAAAIRSSAAWEAAQLANKAAEAARNAQADSPWAINQAKIDAEQAQLTRLEDQKAQVESRTSVTPVQRLVLAVREVAPSALWILGGIIVLPVAVKAMFFFFIAPLADKVPAITIEPSEGELAEPQIHSSGVSLNVQISDMEELLVHPDYLQSTAKSAQKRTKLFLNHRLPLSSLVSGMCLLTRVSAKDGACETVRISPTHDPLGELAVIEVPTGARMVLYPRCIAAVIKPKDQEISIQSRWRLKSLHSWLTLQFRYLVFRGPCKVVLKGCRGVCIEKPAPGESRLISQSATIGFSANLQYSNTRSEVFLNYLRGKDELFNDLFAGDAGIFIYEEMPDARRKTGFTGRGIEGVMDAMLKAFGV